MTSAAATPVRAQPLRIAASIAVVATVAVLLRLMAIGDLVAPPLGTPSALGDWVTARSPVAVAVALVRLAAELTAWYVLALTALHGLAAIPGLRSAARLADALAAPGVARFVHAGLGVGLLASSAVSATAVEPHGREFATSSAAMQPLQQPREPTGVARMAPLPPRDGTATMRPLDPRPSPEPPPGPPADVAPAWPATWTVAEGESLWSIASDLLADALDHPPDAAQVDPLWRRLIETNRHRLVDGDDPDLIVPGQVFEVPAR